ncbi:protein of unknown function (plasmid) [Pararobbsia alpina]
MIRIHAAPIDDAVVTTGRRTATKWAASVRTYSSTEEINAVSARSSSRPAQARSSSPN